MKSSVARVSHAQRNLVAALLLSSALVAFTPHAAHAKPGGIDGFMQSHYTYCDAKLIGKLWGLSVENAKVQIGDKIHNGLGGNIPGILANARSRGYRCTWEDTGYSYDDAEKLAGYWKLAQPYDAKLKVAQLVTNGQSRDVNRILRRN
jgi:hypothetical protein